MPRRATAESPPGSAAEAAAAPEAGPDSASTCVICLDELGDDSHALNCSHRFHAKCLIPWLQRGNRSCPTCRDKPPRDPGQYSEESEDEEGFPTWMPRDERARLQAMEHGYTLARIAWRSREALRREANERGKRKAITKALAKSSKHGAASDKALGKAAREYRSWGAKLSERKAVHDKASTKLRAEERQIDKKVDQMYRDNAKKRSAWWAKTKPLEKQNTKAYRQRIAAEQKKDKAAEALAALVGWEEQVFEPAPDLPDDLRERHYHGWI